MFMDAPIAPEKLERILYAATRSPSAGHTQATRLLVITEPSAREEFWGAIADPSWRSSTKSHQNLDKAPVIILPLEHKKAYLERYRQSDKTYAKIDKISDFPSPYWTIDASFITMLLQLATVNESLAYLFFGISCGLDRLRNDFAIPKTYLPIGGMVIGYPASQRPSASSLKRPRLGIADICHFNRFTTNDK